MIFVSSLYSIDSIKLHVICLFCQELTVNSQHPPWERFLGLRGAICVWTWHSFLCFTWNVLCQTSKSGFIFKVLFYAFKVWFFRNFGLDSTQFWPSLFGKFSSGWEKKKGSILSQNIFNSSTRWLPVEIIFKHTIPWPIGSLNGSTPVLAIYLKKKEILSSEKALIYQWQRQWSDPMFAMFGSLPLRNNNESICKVSWHAGICLYHASLPCADLTCTELSFPALLMLIWGRRGLISECVVPASLAASEALTEWQ